MGLAVSRAKARQASKGDPDSFWFNNENFLLEPFADDSSAKTLMKLSPDGKRLAYVRGRGELVVTGVDKNKPISLFVSDVRPWYEWSPDGKWLVAQAKDSNDNWDIWILAADGSRKPFNLSRHPEWDGGPRWSPNGKMIAFVGRRGRDDEMDVFYVYLSREYEQRSERATKLADAERTLAIARTPPKPTEKTSPASPADGDEKWTPPAFEIDFNDLSDRIKRLSLPDSKETDPFWHSASRKLAFTSDLQGIKGTYYIVFPEDYTPRLVTKNTGLFPIWHQNELHWMVDSHQYSYSWYNTF